MVIEKDSLLTIKLEYWTIWSRDVNSDDSRDQLIDPFPKLIVTIVFCHTLYFCYNSLTKPFLDFFLHDVLASFLSVRYIDVTPKCQEIKFCVFRRDYAFLIVGINRIEKLAFGILQSYDFSLCCRVLHVIFNNRWKIAIFPLERALKVTFRICTN